jgi:hypothetical protein
LSLETFAGSWQKFRGKTKVGKTKVSKPLLQNPRRSRLMQLRNL